MAKLIREQYPEQNLMMVNPPAEHTSFPINEKTSLNQFKLFSKCRFLIKIINTTLKVLLRPLFEIYVTLF